MFKQFESKKFVVGVDVNDSYLQISYSTTNEEEVTTISSVAGAEIYNIPTVLCKRGGVNQWYYGKEALYYARDEENILVENLLAIARDGEPILIEGTEYDPVAVLALFFKRSLAVLTQVIALEKVDAFLFTCEKLDYRMMEIFDEIIDKLGLKKERVFYQSHTESFYYFMLNQEYELWQQKTLLFDYHEDKISIYQMECNRHTRPIVAYISEDAISFPEYEPLPEDPILLENKYKKLDEMFLEISQKMLHNTTASSVYLIGEGFRQGWMKESLRFLCAGRRVFQGENLYSKGACYCAKEKVAVSEISKEYVFLGNNKLTSNIGMKAFDRGQETYVALLDAGENWFEAEKTLDLYLQDGKSLEFQIVSLIGRGSANVKVTLDELTGDVSRIRMYLHMKDENTLVVEIKDMGFGYKKAPGEKIWKEEISL